MYYFLTQVFTINIFIYIYIYIGIIHFYLLYLLVKIGLYRVNYLIVYDYF